MKSVLLFTMLFLLISACSPAVSSPPTPWETPSLSPSQTATPAATATVPATLTPAAATITQLPTIPTFTPTFDVRTIVTATPAPRAECPSLSKDANIKLSNFDDYYPDMLAALNQGAAITNIINLFENEISQHYSLGFIDKIEYQTEDVTGDGVPENILPGSPAGDPEAMIFGCTGGKYQQLLSWPYQMKYLSLAVSDANRNGIPEIFIGDYGCSRTSCSFVLSVFEWRQGTFQLIQKDLEGETASWDVQIADVDKDGFKELSWQVISPPDPLIPPWRPESHVYKWNGVEFVELPVIYASPRYRFQALQDADQAGNSGAYEKAMSLYQAVIFDNALDWWSEDRANYLVDTNPIHYSGVEPTLTFPPPPGEDKTEYPRLAAYAYYRMIILHTDLGQAESARTQYATLQAKFPAGSPGHPYVEMADAFWTAYQTSGRMYDACAAAIAYADAHPEILTPLGSDYHGSQSHIYTPADVCPFR